MASKRLPKNVIFESITVKDTETGTIIERHLSSRNQEWSVESIRDAVARGYEEVVDYKIRKKTHVHPYLGG